MEAKKSDEFGQLLSEVTDTAQATHNMIAIVAAVGILSTIGLGVTLPSTWKIGAVVACAVATLVGGALLVHRFGQKRHLRHFEFGVECKDGNHLTRVHWSELDSLTADLTDNYVNGVYSGTAIAMQFVDKFGRGVKYRNNISKQKEDFPKIEGLRSTASEVVARRMLVELEASGRVHWASTLTIAKDGIERVASRLGEPEFYPYDDISEWKVGNGEVKMCLQGRWFSAAKVRSAAENFYPGLIVLEVAIEAHDRADQREAVLT